MSRFADRCLATVGGLILDRILGEPPDGVHPVAWFGKLMNGVEHATWADSRVRGAAYAVSVLASVPPPDASLDPPPPRLL